MTHNQNSLDLIWKHTHRDYKGMIAGERTLMVNRSGACTIVGLTDLTEAEFTHALEMAKTKAAAQHRSRFHRGE